MEGNCAGNSGRSWAEDDFPELLLPRFLREMLGEDLYEHKGEHSCELCHQNIHSEPTEWVTCKASTLSVSDTGTTVSDAKDMQCFLNADEGPEIRKSVRCVKKEQVRDLLSAERTIFKNTRWQVLFSDYFQKSFQKLRFFSTKKLVINLLLNLARGWRPRKANVDWKCENSSYILKQLKVDIYYVVCSVDIVKDSIYKQVLKVWDILPMTDTTKLLKRIDSIASSYTDEFINHCNEKLFERNLEVPLSWSLSTVIPRFKNTSNSKLVSVASTSSIECNTYVENSKVSESMLLMKFYSMSSGTVTHLLWDSEDNIVDLPFEVTDKEREIINFPRSSFILGRSGTGKTTILTLKLYQKFQMYSLVSRDSVVADDGVSISDEVDAKQCHGGSKGPVLHQLFVTVSSKLCDAVKKNVAQMKSIATENLSNENNFTVMDDGDDASEFKDIPDTFVGIQQERYPLIITFHKFLMMLDGTLGKSYFERFPSVRDSSHSRGQRSVTLETFFRKNEVNYDRFSFIYWPHFNAKLTKSLDASRVFTEIISHIKGGPTEGEARSYKRSRQDYTSLSESRTSTLCVEQRDAIYDIFEDYEKMKIERGDFDLADFVSDIHLRLDKEDFPGDKMDFVYIDEVQDLTMRQISLFRYICNNVDEGFVFSGDTAQTIARGIDFKFEHIRSLFYNEFLMRPRNCDLSGKKEKGLISDMFNLSYNFRTHTGVLNLAQSVVDLLCYYFPHSIDVLAPETSQISGESPIVLEPGNDENLIVSIFGHSEKCGRKWVGFGADQVILVRDDSVKKEVSNYIGHQALILSIVECKGLEFEDVLLYNFFGSSPFSKQWRIVYEFMNKKGLLNGDSAKSFPTFSLSKHNLLCSELKQLYVAITRTKQRLWICENNVEASKPMLDYWKRLSLVQVTTIDDTLAETMHRASTPEEWKSQGIQLFWEKNYEMATMCFAKAGDETWEKRAKASGLRAAADSLCGSNSEKAAVMLREAAAIFDSIDRVEAAAECFYELGEYERAGLIYRDKGGKSELRKAGECFSLAGKYELSAEVYESGGLWRDCLSACTKGNHVDLGLQYIEKWKQQALSNSIIMTRLVEIDGIVQEFLENCALECHKAKDSASLTKFVRSFCSTESKRNFLKSLDCLEELLVLEEELGNFCEASEIAKSLGDTLREADLLEKAGQFSNACLLILSHVISTVLWGSGNQGWPLKSFPQKLELLDRVMSIAQKVSETFHASICALVNLLLYDQKKLSELMQFYYASKQYEIPVGEILALRKLLDVHVEVNATKYEWDNSLHLDPLTFERRITRDQVSTGTLVYVWNLWKMHSLEIIECLDNLERTNSIKLEGVVGFCFSYFGMRLIDKSSVTLHLLNPSAAWIKNAVRFIRQNRNLATLEARHFALSAREFWLQELIAVGLRVLDALQKLSRSPMAKLSVQYSQSVCLLHIFDVANFLLDLKSINTKNKAYRKLEDFVQLCIRYFLMVFSVDPRTSLDENMISLRETDLSRNLLEECVLRNIGRRELNIDQIGLALLTMLGNGNLKHSFYDKIVERLSNDTPWKSFIENLWGIVESDSVKESKHDTVCMKDSPSRCSIEALSEALHKALQENWDARIHMFPPYFLYLLERLLILVPHPKGFFFTTKSSLVEYLTSLPPDSNPRTGLSDHKTHPTIMVEFVRIVVEEILTNRATIVKWVKDFRIKSHLYFPILVLRLLLILCVLCINGDLSFDRISQLISQPDIKSQLPREFCEALRPSKHNCTQLVSAVATAFKLVGDPLVVVVLGDTNRKFPSPDAVFLDLRPFYCKGDIMRTLFPKSTEASHDQPTTTTVERNMTGIVNDGKKTIRKSSKMASKTSSNASSENENLQINWNLIREISYLESENVKSLILRKKVEVDKHLNFKTIPSALPIEQRSDSAAEEDKDFLGDFRGVVRDFNKLISMTKNVKHDHKAMQDVCELIKSLDKRQPLVDTYLSLLDAGKDNKDGEKKKPADRKLIDDEDGSKIDDSEVVDVEPNPKNKGACSQAKGKNNNKKKKKEHKKGKGGRKK